MGHNLAKLRRRRRAHASKLSSRHPSSTVRPPTRLELAWYRIVWSIVWPPGWLLWRPTVVGRENLPQTTPYIISPVHRSNIDTFLTARITEPADTFHGERRGVLDQLDRKGLQLAR